MGGEECRREEINARTIRIAYVGYGLIIQRNTDQKKSHIGSKVKHKSTSYEAINHIGTLA